MSINDIRQLVWQGALNVQITVKPTLLAVDESPKDCAVNLRIPRDIYLTCYLPAIIARVRDSLRVDLDDEEQHIWLEFENVPLYWNYPAGVLYDSMIGLNPSEREDKDAENSLEVWRLELAQGPKLPPGVIPLTGGLQQIRSYLMHQWKQACFILNGSSKQVMSLSMQESSRFWESVVTRDQENFIYVANKVIPFKPRFIPVIIHQTLPEVKLFQPVMVHSKDDGTRTKLIDLIQAQFPNLFQKDHVSLSKVVSNGIELPLTEDLYDLYNRLFSLDGFLHLSICLITDSEYAEEASK